MYDKKMESCDLHQRMLHHPEVDLILTKSVPTAAADGYP